MLYCHKRGDARMEHLFFDSIDEMRNQTGSHGPNYLRNHTAERDYFSPLSIVTSIQKPQEYLFSNYMDAWSFCVHTPNKHEFFHETYMHKHNFFELMYVQRGQVRVMIEGAETTYTQGNLCLLNRNTMHRETDMSNADIVYIGIDASLLTQWPKSFPPTQCTPLSDEKMNIVLSQMPFSFNNRIICPTFLSTSLTIEAYAALGFICVLNPLDLLLI